MKILMLLRLAIGLAIGELVTLVIVVAEDVPDSEPAMLAVSVLPWLVGALLLHRGKVIGGSVLLAIYALFHVASYATWKRTSTLDWVWQSVYAVTALTCLATAISVIVSRQRAAVTS